MANTEHKITARNYAAQCENGLRRTLDRHAGNDRRVVAAMADRIAGAVHFVMPDGGGLFDDKGKGIAGRELRLPFPLVTIEYHCDNKDAERGLIEMAKRVIIAEELTADEVRARSGRIAPKKDAFAEDENYIFISWAATSPSDGSWVAGPCALAIPRHWDRDVGNPDRTHFESLTGNRDVTKIAGIPVVQLEALAMRYVEHLGTAKEAMQHMVHDVATEASVIIEFCEALSCSNVGMAIAQPGLSESKAARRARDGKIPIYETRVLTVDVGTGKHQRLSGTAGDGFRSSPAQHLRRGHIRRLSSGKNIWVNSCVVGASEHGVINKTYAVRRAS